jgi:hypothetical protein
MSLAKFIAQHGPEALKWLQANKKGLALGAGGTALAAGGAMAAAPYVDDFMTERAIDSIQDNIKSGLVDALDFAEEHPYVTAAALGGAGMLGSKLGDEGFAGLMDTVSPIKIGALFNQRSHGRGRRP